MQLFIAFLVIGFLEQDVCTNACFVKLSVVLHSGSSNIYINTADSTVLMFNIINSVYGFQHIFNRIVYRILSQFNGQALVAHILQGNNFLANLILSQLLTANMLILGMVRAIQTAVDAIIGKIQWGKQYNTIAVVILLNLTSQIIDFLQLGLVVTGQKYGSLPMGKSLAQLSLSNNLIHNLHIVLVFVSIFQGCLNFLVRDKFLCLHGFYIIHLTLSYGL